MIKRNVIWIASYPKSGNTWIHSVLRLAGKNYGFPQSDLDVYNISKGGKELLVCDAVEEKFLDNPCVVLKTHSPFKVNQPLHQLPNVELVNVAYIYIYRNPLDVLLSYLNFTRISYKNNIENPIFKNNLFIELLGLTRNYDYNEWLGMSLDKIPQSNLDHALDYFSENSMVLKGLGEIAGSWLENTQSWIDISPKFPGCSIRYEDCLGNPEPFIQLSEFFKFGRTDVLSSLEHINHSVQSMSAGGGNQMNTIFYNKMRAFYFVDYFSKDAISRFLTRYEDVLKYLGYESLFNLM
jgi:hypothetical protein